MKEEKIIPVEELFVKQAGSGSRARALGLCKAWGIRTAQELATYNQLLLRKPGARSHSSKKTKTIDYIESCLNKLGLQLAPKPRCIGLTPYEMIGRENVVKDIINSVEDGWRNVDSISSHCTRNLQEKLKGFGPGGERLIDNNDVYRFSEVAFREGIVRQLTHELVEEGKLEESYSSGAYFYKKK